MLFSAAAAACALASSWAQKLLKEIINQIGNQRERERENHKSIGKNQRESEPCDGAIGFNFNTFDGDQISNIMKCSAVPSLCSCCCTTVLLLLCLLPSPNDCITTYPSNKGYGFRSKQKMGPQKQEEEEDPFVNPRQDFSFGLLVVKCFLPSN